MSSQVKVVGSARNVHVVIDSQYCCHQCSNGTGTHRNAVPVLFWTTRLMVKLHQAYVLASEGLAR